MKKIVSWILFSVLILSLFACQSDEDIDVEQHTDPDGADSDIMSIELPDDFSFFFEYGSNFCTSYDSSTGKLIENYISGDEKSGNVRYVKLSQYELKVIYGCVFEKVDFFSLPSDLTPYFQRENSGALISSNNFYKLKIVADGKEKTVKLDDLFYAERTNDEYMNEATSFSKVANELSLLLSMSFSQ